MLAFLAALLILTSGLAAMYYGQAQNQEAQAKAYASELDQALSKYSTLGTNFQSSLLGYNRTLSLLTQALSNLNTSTPSYAAGSSALKELWSVYVVLARQSGLAHISYSVNVFVDFGNGTRTWYNDTSVQPGWNDYIATLDIFGGSLQATWYPQFGEHFVTGIGGADSNRTTSWFFFTGNATGWTMAPTGADAVQAYDGSVFAWRLCGYDASFNPTCRP